MEHINTYYILCCCCVEKRENSHRKNISSNQLFSNSFRKCVAFTKFLTINKNVTKKVGKSLC